jgi:aspartate aminotransferase-like enzyme
MCPPGLAFASVSGRAFEAGRGAAAPRYYFDWKRTRASQEKGENPFSPAISLYLGLDVALGMILEEGLESAYERHVRLGRACRAGVKAMGLDLFSPDEDRAAVVTAIRMPPDVDGQSVVLAMRERSGVTIIGGQGELRGKIVRIGHIGYVDVFDVTTALAALERALAEAGADLERSLAVTAALDAYNEPVHA